MSRTLNRAEILGAGDRPSPALSAVNQRSRHLLGRLSRRGNGGVPNRPANAVVVGGSEPRPIVAVSLAIMRAGVSIRSHDHRFPFPFGRQSRHWVPRAIRARVPTPRPPRKPIVTFASFRYQAKSWTASPSGDGQGRIAPRGRLHRYQPGPDTRAGGQVSITAAARPSSGSRRARTRCALDAALLPRLPAQRRSAPAACAGLQPRQIPAHLGAAGGGRALVADDIAREAGQDGRPGRAPRPYVVFQLAEVAVQRTLFAEILRRIDRLRPSPRPLLA